MKHIPFEELSPIVREFLAPAVSDEYARKIAENETEFLSRVREDIETASAWSDEEYYNDSDVRYAIGRIILEYIRKDELK